MSCEQCDRVDFAAVSKRAGVKRVVIHTHNNSFGAGNLALKKLLRIISIGVFGSIPDLYLACSEEAGKWTFGTGIERKENYHVIYNGIDQRKFLYNMEKRNKLRKYYSLADKFIVGHIGHFNYQKIRLFCCRPFKMCAERFQMSAISLWEREKQKMIFEGSEG